MLCQSSSICRSCRLAFTLIEVLVAMAVLAVISVGLLATTWKLTGIARNYVDCMVADSYCHDVLYVAHALVRADRHSSISWKIDPGNELPKIESEDLFRRKKTVYPLWRRKDEKNYPDCTVEYKAAVPSNNLVVTVKWLDVEGVEQTRSAHATVQ